MEWVFAAAATVVIISWACWIMWDERRSPGETAVHSPERTPPAPVRRGGKQLSREQERLGQRLAVTATKRAQDYASWAAAYSGKAVGLADKGGVSGSKCIRKTLAAARAARCSARRARRALAEAEVKGEAEREALHDECLRAAIDAQEAYAEARSAYGAAEAAVLHSRRANLPSGAARRNVRRSLRTFPERNAYEDESADS